MTSWDASSTAAVISAAIALLAWVASLLQLRYSYAWRRRDEASAVHALLAAFEQEHASVVQPSLATLADFKWQHPDGELWTALTAVPNKANAADGLQMPHGASLQEHRARNAAKNFWKRLLEAVEQQQLPPGFGSISKQLDGRRVVQFGADHNGATWRERANNFRLLVEPFDIANYYRMGLHNSESGHYLENDNRPEIFTALEAMTIAHLRAQKQAAGSMPQPAAPAAGGGTTTDAAPAAPPPQQPHQPPPAATATRLHAAAGISAAAQPQQSAAVAAPTDDNQPAEYVSSVVWALALAHRAASRKAPKVPAPVPPADWGWGEPPPQPNTLKPTQKALLPP